MRFFIEVAYCIYYWLRKNVYKPFADLNSTPEQKSPQTRVAGLSAIKATPTVLKENIKFLFEDMRLEYMQYKGVLLNIPIKSSPNHFTCLCLCYKDGSLEYSWEDTHSWYWYEPDFGIRCYNSRDRSYDLTTDELAFINSDADLQIIVSKFITLNKVLPKTCSMHVNKFATDELTIEMRSSVGIPITYCKEHQAYVQILRKSDRGSSIANTEVIKKSPMAPAVQGILSVFNADDEKVSTTIDPKDYDSFFGDLGLRDFWKAYKDLHPI